MSAYYILYGVAPVFKNLLLQSLVNSLFYAFLFDESMNDHLQKIQMDVQITYWHDETSRALTHYIDSWFVLRANKDKISTELVNFQQ